MGIFLLEKLTETPHWIKEIITLYHIKYNFKCLYFQGEKSKPQSHRRNNIYKLKCGEIFICNDNQKCVVSTPELFHVPKETKTPNTDSVL